MLILIEPPYTERYVRWCERTVIKIINYLLLDLCVNTPVPLSLVIGLSGVNFKGSVNLLQQNNFEQLVGECHFGK